MGGKESVGFLRGPTGDRANRSFPLPLAQLLRSSFKGMYTFHSRRNIAVVQLTTLPTPPMKLGMCDIPVDIARISLELRKRGL